MLVRAGEQDFVVPTLARINYGHQPIGLKFSTSFEELTTVPKGRFDVINTVTGLPVELRFGWGGDSDSTYNYGWVEPTQDDRGVSAHSGSKSLGLQTASTKRIELLMEYDEIQSLGLTQQIYISQWFYFASDWHAHDHGWGPILAVFQTSCLASGGGYSCVPYYQFYLEDTHGSNGIVDLRLGYRSGDGVQTPVVARVYNVDLNRGGWSHFEWFQTWTTSSSARVMTWWNGQLLWNVTGRPTLKGSSGYHLEFGKIYHASTSHLYEKWIDDVEFWDGIPL